MARTTLSKTTLMTLVTMLVASSASAYEPPRTSNGKPDLQGVWTNSSLTGLSRPRNVDKLVLTPQEAEDLASGHFHNVRLAKEFEKSDPNKTAPPKLDRLPPVGNYNASWVDPGTKYAVVKGEIRTSWLVEPEDGRVPYKPELIEGIRERRQTLRATPDDPEVMALGERCLLGFGGTAGPPMLNVLYNNYYRIVQTEDHVVFVVEMVHDARIVRLDGEHAPADNKAWLGDSIGRWEGDTLVIETTNFHPARAGSGPLYYSDQAKVVERVTRVSDKQLFYEFEIEDPKSYTSKVKGEMVFNNVEDRPYEYACHEGNYAMPSILKGARLEEQDADE